MVSLTLASKVEITYMYVEEILNWVLKQLCINTMYVPTISYVACSYCLTCGTAILTYTAYVYLNRRPRRLNK